MIIHIIILFIIVIMIYYKWFLNFQEIKKINKYITPLNLEFYNNNNNIFIFSKIFNNF
jgi:hypothetical protein